jgi:hypothetical protein
MSSRLLDGFRRTQMDTRKQDERGERERERERERSKHRSNDIVDQIRAKKKIHFSFFFFFFFFLIFPPLQNFHGTRKISALKIFLTLAA